jgi:outer membrane protein assembly factor BamB
LVVVCVVPLLLIAVAAVVGFARSAGRAGAGSADGNAPPEWAANRGGWPSHNYDLSNTRADFDTRIDARDVSTLTPRWRFQLHGGGIFGVFTSNPIVLGGVVYFEDSDSDVYALRLSTGRLVWSAATTRSRRRVGRTVWHTGTGCCSV